MTFPNISSRKNASGSSTRTYAERYCDYFELPLERFTDHLFARSLHAPLRWLWPLLGWSIQASFLPDRHCVEAIGRSRSREEVYSELAEYGYSPHQHGFWRRRLRQRLSSRRLLRILRSLPKQISIS